MKPLDKYILYSSIFALFSEDFNFHFIIDVKLYYFILIINIVLLFFKKSFYINKNILLIISFFTIHGLIMYLFNANNPVFLLTQLIGISLSSMFFYSLIKSYGTKKTFTIYLKMAYYFALLAIPMFYLDINVTFYNRLNGIMSEPAHYASIMLPATYIFYKTKKYYKFSLLTLTIILSQSSLGFIGLILIVILPLLKLKYLLRFTAITAIGLLIIGNYIRKDWNNEFNESSQSQITLRVKQTYESFTAIINGKFKQDTNLSSYAILSNAFIAKNNFIDHPLGTGLGSYSQQYEKYYPIMNPPKYLVTIKFSKINKDDANSLALRLISDLGIFGLVFIIYFFFRAYIVFTKKDNNLQQGSFIYLALKLLREGHYFPPEFHFFLLIFLKDFNDDTTYS